MTEDVVEFQTGRAGEYVEKYRAAPQDLIKFNGLTVAERLAVIKTMPYYQAVVLVSDQCYVAEGYWRFGPHQSGSAEKHKRSATELVARAKEAGLIDDFVRKFPRLEYKRDGDAYFEEFGVVVGGRKVGKVRQQLYWDRQVCQYFNPDARWPEKGVVVVNNEGREYDLFDFLPSKKVYHVLHGHPGAYPADVESIGFQSHVAIFRFMHEGCHQLEEQMLEEMSVDPGLAKRGWGLMQTVLAGEVKPGVIKDFETAQALVEYDQQPWLKALGLWSGYCQHLGIGEDNEVMIDAWRFAGSAMALMMENILLATDPELHDKLQIDSTFMDHPEMVQVLDKEVV